MKFRKNDIPDRWYNWRFLSSRATTRLIVTRLVPSLVINVLFGLPIISIVALHMKNIIFSSSENAVNGHGYVTDPKLTPPQVSPSVCILSARELVFASRLVSSALFWPAVPPDWPAPASYSLGEPYFKPSRPKVPSVFAFKLRSQSYKPKHHTFNESQKCQTWTH